MALCSGVVPAQISLIAVMDKASPVSYQKLTREPPDLYQLLSDDIHDSVSSVCPCLIYGLVPTNGK